MKTCNKCGEEKDLSAFPKNNQASDGRHGKCKACTNDYLRAYRATPKGAAKERERQRRRYAQNRDSIQARQKRQKEHHPERTKANAAVRTAIRRGEMAPPSACECNDCKKPAAELHHHSYEPEHWLDVVPLCRSCHRIRHDQFQRSV